MDGGSGGLHRLPTRAQHQNGARGAAHPASNLVGGSRGLGHPQLEGAPLLGAHHPPRLRSPRDRSSVAACSAIRPARALRPPRGCPSLPHPGHHRRAPRARAPWQGPWRRTTGAILSPRQSLKGRGHPNPGALLPVPLHRAEAPAPKPQARRDRGVCSPQRPAPLRRSRRDGVIPLRAAAHHSSCPTPQQAHRSGDSHGDRPSRPPALHPTGRRQLRSGATLHGYPHRSRRAASLPGGIA